MTQYSYTKKPLNASDAGLGYISNKSLLSSSPKLGINPYQRPITMNFNSPKNTTQKPLVFTGKTHYDYSTKVPQPTQDERAKEDPLRKSANGFNSTQGLNPTLTYNQYNPMYSPKNYSAVEDKRMSYDKIITAHNSDNLMYQNSVNSVRRNTNAQTSYESAYRPKKELQINTEMSNPGTTLKYTGVYPLTAKNISTRTPSEADSPIQKKPSINGSFDKEAKLTSHGKAFLNRTQQIDEKELRKAESNPLMMTLQSKYTHYQPGKAYDESGDKGSHGTARKVESSLNKLLQVYEKHSAQMDRMNGVTTGHIYSPESNGVSMQQKDPTPRSNVKFNNFFTSTHSPSGEDSAKKLSSTQTYSKIPTGAGLITYNGTQIGKTHSDHLKNAPTYTNRLSEQAKRNSLAQDSKDVKPSVTQSSDQLKGFVTKLNPGEFFSTNSIKVKPLQPSSQDSPMQEEKKPSYQETLTKSAYNDKSSSGKVEESQLSRSQDLAAYVARLSRTSNNATATNKGHFVFPSNKEANEESSKENQAKSNRLSTPMSTGKYNFLPLQREGPENSTAIETKASQVPYYVPYLQKYLKAHDESDYFSQIYREHFIQSYQALNFIKNSKPVDQRVLQSKKVTLPRRPGYVGKKTIIFDLDETLIHCNENTNMAYDVKLPIKFPHGQIIEAGINIRPYAVECLKELSQYFEIVVFTASHGCYANVVLDYLDPREQYVHHRLFRESCVQTPEGIYIKDLRILANRELSDVVLVDNAAYSFGYQIENGIPIIPFYYNKKDQELRHLVTYLKSLVNVKDLREEIRQTFKFHRFTEFDSSDKLMEKIVTSAL